MKKSIMFVLVLGLMVIGFHSVSACDVSDPCGSNGSPAMVIGAWGTNNAGVPALAFGQSVTDGNGIRMTCYLYQGCVDVSHTSWYETQIATLKSQLGTSNFAYWVSLLK